MLRLFFFSFSDTLLSEDIQERVEHMSYFIDRRLNPGDKNLGNRQRFMRRVRKLLRRHISEAMKHRSIRDIERQERIPIPIDGTGEPNFRDAPTGRREGVFPGNKKFMSGDKIPRSQKGWDGSGREGSPDGEGMDDFEFVLTPEEFDDLFFEDCELPRLVKEAVQALVQFRRQRAGFTKSGTPAHLDVFRTMKNSFGRRIALRRPRTEEVRALEARIQELEAKDIRTPEEEEELREKQAELTMSKNRMRQVPFMDPFDARFRRYELVPLPIAQAVMFCLMDVSGSMGEREKDLAKRFFYMLYRFLFGKYEQVDVVFIRHTHEAAEVDEETFFHSPESGGTVVSTAFHEMLRIVKERYPISSWNIYVAQASDGDNTLSDNELCAELLVEQILPIVQHFAYIEIIAEGDEENMYLMGGGGSSLWQTYTPVNEQFEEFAMKFVAHPKHIYPVFRELFARKEAR